VSLPPFLGAGGEGARAALFGAPLDVTTSFRPGARFGPAAIRQASWVLEEWSLAAGEGLEQHPFADEGDLELAPGEVEGALEAVHAAARRVLERGLRPVVLGGEHLVTLPVVRAAADRFPGLAGVQLDAHADLRDEYMGLRLSHATVMRRVAEVVGAGSVFQFGIRSATAEEAAFARRATRLHPFSVLEPLRRVRPELEGRPVYVTVDVDVADPAYAPGTGTPEPGGVTAAELLAAVGELRGLEVVGFDVVEVAPAYDPGGITAALAAKVVREALIAVT
jgi:agmatinase